MATRKRQHKRVGQDVIVAQLRRGIVDGTILPGERLPTHEQVQRKFQTTRVTVQRAFDRLAADGFIRTAPKIGSFVAERPPHLSRYGLVFFGRPDPDLRSMWSRASEAVIEASRVLSATHGISFSNYFDVNGHLDSEGYQTLMRDIEDHRLAGICFATAPFMLMETPLMERSDPPRVTAANRNMGMPARTLDSDAFIELALDALEADGRRRVAIITKPDIPERWSDHFVQGLAERGMISLPYWTQAVEPHQTRWVRHAVHAILNSDPNLVPDALVITDDHLVEAVGDALPEFGVRVPPQMRVIGHWNFPLPYRGRAAIDLLGFDMREVLQSWVDAIDGQRRGEKVNDYELIPPRFAWELRRDQGEADEKSLVKENPHQMESS